MRIRVMHGVDLSGEEIHRWQRVQWSSRRFANPYFCPHFTQVVGQVRNDTFVGVIENGSRTVGFFPFQRGRLPLGRPVGGPLSDYQAVIVEKDAYWTADQLVRGCGLCAWHFDHLIAEQEPFLPYHRVTSCSPTIDLPEGFRAYVRRRQDAGSKLFRKVAAARRRLERHAGPLRVETHTDDDRVFTQLLRWKSDQYVQTRLPDVFSFAWTVNLLDRIRSIQTPDFAGILSAMWAGDRLVAAHMGMRSRTVWHYWFPAYDPAFATFSPGLILLLKMAATAESLGITRIDLGKGDSLYKQRLKTDAVILAEGRVAVPSVAAAVTGAYERAAEWIRLTSGAMPDSIPGRLFRRVHRWGKFR